MENGRIIADDTPRKISSQLYDMNNPMFKAMPTPTRIFFDTDGRGDCPLTVREGRNWLDKTFIDEPKIAGFSSDEIDLEIKNPALSIKEIWFRYEKESQDILRGVDMCVPTGSLYAIVGGNGAGKSTTLKSICGICMPYRGKIKVFGKDIKKYKNRELFKNCISMLPQDPKSIFVKKTVREELEEMTIVRETPVIAVRMNDVSGALNDILNILQAADINIEYVYAFTGSVAGDAYVVLRVDDEVQAEKTLNDNNIKTLTDEDINNYLK